MQGFHQVAHVSPSWRQFSASHWSKQLEFKFVAALLLEMTDLIDAIAQELKPLFAEVSWHVHPEAMEGSIKSCQAA